LSKCHQDYGLRVIKRNLALNSVIRVKRKSSSEYKVVNKNKTASRLNQSANDKSVNVLNVILKLSQTTILKKQLKNCQPTNPNLNKYREQAKERQSLKE